MTSQDRLKFFDQITRLHERTGEILRESLRAGALDVKYEVTEYLNVYAAAMRDLFEEGDVDG